MAPKGHVLKAWASEMLGSEETWPNKRSLGHWGYPQQVCGSPGSFSFSPLTFHDVPTAWCCHRPSTTHPAVTDC